MKNVHAQTTGIMETKTTVDARLVTLKIVDMNEAKLPDSIIQHAEESFIDNYEERILGDTFFESERQRFREILRSSLASVVRWAMLEGAKRISSEYKPHIAAYQDELLSLADEIEKT